MKKKSFNPNKTVSVTANNFTVYYTDSQKHFEYPFGYDRPLAPFLQKLQVEGDNYMGKQYQDHTVELNRLQEKHYREALFGLEVYKKAEIDKMSVKHRARIVAIHQKAQRILNEWKQELLNPEIDNFLLALFPKSKNVKKFVEIGKGYTTNKEKFSFSFKELGLSKLDIFNKLVEKDLIPASIATKKAA